MSMPELFSLNSYRSIGVVPYKHKSQQDAEGLLNQIFDLTKTIFNYLSATFYSNSRRIDWETLYYNRANKAAPPSADLIHIKSDTRTFNYLNDYAMESGFLWYRRRNTKEWKPFYFDGFSKGETPAKIDADGANLIVIDQNGVVHYKKVFKEYRQGELLNRKVRHFEGVILGEKVDYFVVDKSALNNWKKAWTTTPFLHYLINLISGKRLTLPRHKAVAISHRGVYSDYLEDREKRHHLTDSVTTLYTLNVNGKQLSKFDPFSPIFARTQFHFPESATKTFTAENFSVSASTLMAIGYAYEKGGLDKRLTILTKLVDMDSEGWNPWKKYSWIYHPNSQFHILPVDRWKSHPFDLKKNHFLTNEITILQTGAGNNTRELRVKGIHQEKGTGYFFKMIDDHKWNFCQTFDVSMMGLNPLSITQETPGEFESSVHNYLGRMFLDKFMVPVKLENFGRRSYESQLLFEWESREYTLSLFKRKSFKNFIGLKGSIYDLVVPEEYHSDNEITKIFKSRFSHRVSVNKYDRKICISCQFLNLIFLFESVVDG